MHAVVFTVDVKQDSKANPDEELELISSITKTAPGFVRGTWTTDGKRGVSFIVFDTERAARAFADDAAVPPDASVSLRSVDVYEVVRDI